MTSLGTRGVPIELSGTVQVCCVHDRVKRVVVTEEQVAKLGEEMGIVYDARLHRIIRCTCCENLFVDLGDEPKRCGVCEGKLAHLLGGPLPEPGGPVDA